MGPSELKTVEGNDLGESLRLLEDHDVSRVVEAGWFGGALVGLVVRSVRRTGAARILHRRRWMGTPFMSTPVPGGYLFVNLHT